MKTYDNSTTGLRKYIIQNDNQQFTLYTTPTNKIISPYRKADIRLPFGRNKNKPYERQLQSSNDLWVFHTLAKDNGSDWGEPHTQPPYEKGTEVISSPERIHIIHNISPQEYHRHQQTQQRGVIADIELLNPKNTLDNIITSQLGQYTQESKGPIQHTQQEIYDRTAQQLTDEKKAAYALDNFFRDFPIIKWDAYRNLFEK